jgi:hypothetical protein
MDGISNVGQTLGAVNVAMLKKTQDLVANQVLELIQTLPQSPSGGGVGGQIDVTG